MMWSNKLTCWVVRRNTVFGERGAIQPRPGRQKEERERGKRGKISQAELIPLEINNWRHSFCVWAQTKATKMALKMPFGQEYWNERNTSRYKLLMGVCDCLSGGEAERRAEAILPHPGWIAKQELAATELAAVLRCVRSSDASLLEHMQNLSKISLHYDPRARTR